MVELRLIPRLRPWPTPARQKRRRFADPVAQKFRFLKSSGPTDLLNNEGIDDIPPGELANLHLVPRSRYLSPPSLAIGKSVYHVVPREPMGRYR